MPLDLVIGAQWGDEGKGRITDNLAGDADVVARFSGGDNAGHSVTVQEKLFKLHLIPSGIIHQHTTCVMGSGMVINPAALMIELDALSQAGVDIDPGRLLISRSAHMITPGHLALDQAEEALRGGSKLGTTRRGIGPAYTDKTARRGLRMESMLDHRQFTSHMRRQLQAANRLLESVYGLQGVDIETAVTEFNGHAERLRPYMADTGHFLSDALRSGLRVIGEGAQGTLLDLDHGTYPFVTSSHPTTAGALQGLGIGPQYLDRIIGVAKAFQTRVGEGPFPSEVHGAIASRLRGTGEQPWDEYGTTTGRPRRCGWLDLVLLRYAQRVNGFSELALTKLDILSGLASLSLCSAYTIGGMKIDELIEGLSSLALAQPMLDELAGWDEEITDLRSWDSLPPNARSYIERVETNIGIPVRIISLGPERQQLILRN